MSCERCELNPRVGFLAHCNDCIAIAKVGTCTKCQIAYNFFPNEPSYGFREKEFKFFCGNCLISTHCVECNNNLDDHLVCDNCHEKGVTCLKCAGLSSIPVSKWYCKKCSEVIPSRKRLLEFKNNEYCSYNATGSVRKLQYWVHCYDCFPNDLDKIICLSCVSCCHAGHRLSKELYYREVYCDCECPQKKKNKIDYIIAYKRKKKELEALYQESENSSKLSGYLNLKLGIYKMEKELEELVGILKKK